jgi:small subunit ribosomal protein S3
MGHKVHPKSFRIKDTADWESRWLSKKDFPKYLEEDFIIRRFLIQKLKEASVQNIEIERFADKINIIVNTSRPGLVIGRGGTGAETLRKEIEKKILFGKKNVPRQKREIKIEIREVKDPWLSASLVGQNIAQQLEKRMPFRRVLKQMIEKTAAHRDVKGVRIEISGRLDGRTIAGREWLKRGRMPRQTIRADIDFSTTEAHCSYGVIGIKVWIYKGEKF